MSEPASKTPPRETPLHEKHVAARAKMVDFGGWHMPVSYPPGILEEHRTVRTGAGLFDVSHMGEARLTGAGAFEVVQRLCSNDLGRVADGSAMYTVMCSDRGGIVDDCIVYRIRADELLIVLNAGNIAKDLAHIRAVAGSACTVSDESDATALLAVQGPRALALMDRIASLPAAPSSMKRNQHALGSVLGIPARVAFTGYTGEDGVEIFCAAADAPRLWDGLLAAGADLGLAPIGLGARDTLRLEARLSLYGNDIDDDTTPLEAGLSWVVKLDKPDFVGKAALVRQKAEGIRRQLVGFVVQGRGIARHGYPIHGWSGGGSSSSAGRGGEAPLLDLGPLIGQVTSGTTGPTVGAAIGLGYVPVAEAQPGTKLAIDCRGKLALAEVVKGPFYSKGAKA